MAEKLDPKELVSIEELAISSMWEIASLFGTPGAEGDSAEGEVAPLGLLLLE